MPTKRVVRFICLALFLFICDASIKYFVHAKFIDRQCLLPFYPYGGIGVFHNFLGIDFCINHVRNQGGAWGIFSSYPTVMTILRIGLICALFVYAVFVNKERTRDLPFLLILTGALSNLCDYFIYGSVIDMFHFTLWKYSFPVFNVADVMIFLGVMAWLILSCVEKYKMDHNKHKTQSP